MKKYACSLSSSLLVMVLLVIFTSAAETQTFSNYQDMRKHVGELFQQQKYEEAALVLETHLQRFPDNVHANSYNLGLMYVMLEDYGKSIEFLEYGLDHGIWFGKYDFFADVWKPLKEAEGFVDFIEKNNIKWEAAQKESRPKLEVKVPENYSPERSYPLFIALHGGNENLEAFIPVWASPLLRNEYIVAYPQSSQLVSMNGYSWSEDIALTKAEIDEAYAEVKTRFPVDEKNVVIGGFSSGGQAALVAVIENVVPVSGFVVLCPPRPAGFDREAVARAKERGIRGTLLTTEMDPRIKDQEAMREIMTSVGLPLEFIVTPNTGHWYPENLAEKIDAALRHIREKSLEKE